MAWRVWKAVANATAGGVEPSRVELGQVGTGAEPSQEPSRKPESIQARSRAESGAEFRVDCFKALEAWKLG